MTDDKVSLRELMDMPFGKPAMIVIIGALAATSTSVGVALGAMLAETVSYIAVAVFFIVGMVCMEVHRILQQKMHDAHTAEGKALQRDIDQALAQLQAAEATRQ